MRAITITEPGGPEVLQVTDVPTPSPKAGEVLIKIAAAGVNWPDVQQRLGRYPVPPGASPLPGLECSGTIEAVGDRVAGWQPGDPCVALLSGGGYAEYATAPAGQVLAPPDGVDLVSAAGLMEVAATVVSNLDRAALAVGETFLVHGGAGGIGSFATQYAKSLGATVITTAGAESKLEYCRSLGADLAVSYHDDWAAAIAEFTGQRGVDVILDIIGAKYLEANTTALAMDGRLVIIGLQGGRKATLDIAALMAKRATVTGTMLRPRPVEQKAAICRQVADEVWPHLADGSIKPVRETRMSLDEAAAAHTQLESGDNVGKILLVA
ncbi:NAD(P)H-quinone oxidoreductase [Microlunatus elymi]|uniref:NAD(P)H-quinone oxidoreductase n=1 Tax=Microlunatus elymi TaxID=2596828 RepID=A0A516PUY8_9ACTN|nr:NAD(P)H-quinone oxidoreductase [Microlunatus elymi]QDP94963.1 NAD(P)H-quinone oxidoreductase [Microlunatus elymi]